jgi:hypothetical protein
VVRPAALVRLEAALVPRGPVVTPSPPADIGRALDRGEPPPPRLRPEILSGADGPALTAAGFELSRARPFPAGPVARLPVHLPLGQTVFGFLVRAPDDAPTGQRGTIDLVHRDARGRVVGGLAIEVMIGD